jgi:hypothetical protein
MRPPVPQVVEAAVRDLHDLAGASEVPEIAGRLGTLALLLELLGQSWDTAAADRVAAIERYLDVVRRGADLAPAELAAALRAQETTPWPPADLRISALEARLDELRTALIPLHAWLEDQTTTEARQVLADVWRAELEDVASRDFYQAFW